MRRRRRPDGEREDALVSPQTQTDRRRESAQQRRAVLSRNLCRKRQQINWNRLTDALHCIFSASASVVAVATATATAVTRQHDLPPETNDCSKTYTYTHIDSHTHTDCTPSLSCVDALRLPPPVACPPSLLVSLVADASRDVPSLSLFLSFPLLLVIRESRWLIREDASLQSRRSLGSKGESLGSWRSRGRMDARKRAS